MDSSSQITISGGELLPAPVANLQHFLRVHYVGFVRSIAVILFSLSGAIGIMAIQRPTPWAIAIIFTVICSSIAAMFALGIKAFRPCQCGKVSESSKVTRLQLRLQFRSFKKRPISWLFLSLPVSVVIAFAADVALGHLPAFATFLSVVRLSVACYVMAASVTMFFGVNTKWFRDRLQTTLTLTEAGFGQHILENKSADELNSLIHVALQNGRIDQADVISQHLLSKAESSDQ